MQMNHRPHRFQIACLIAVSLAAGCAVAVDDAGEIDDDPGGLDEVPLSRCPSPSETGDPQAALERIQPVYASSYEDCVSAAGAKLSASSKAVPSVANARADARVPR